MERYIEWLECMLQVQIDHMDEMYQEEGIDSDYPIAIQKIFDEKKEEFRNKINKRGNKNE